MKSTAKQVRAQKMNFADFQLAGCTRTVRIITINTPHLSSSTIKELNGIEERLWLIRKKLRADQRVQIKKEKYLASLPGFGDDGTNIMIGEHRCHSGNDGDCFWRHCPQLRDDEPQATGRDCPYYNPEEEY